MTDPGAPGTSGPSEESKSGAREEKKAEPSEESKSGASEAKKIEPSEESQSGASEEKRGSIQDEIVKGLKSVSQKLDDWKDKLTEIHDALDRFEATVARGPVETLHQMSLYEDRVKKLEELVGELERETGGTEDPDQVKDFRRDMVMAVNDMTQWMEPEIDAVRQGKDWTLGNILNVLAHLEGCVEAYKK